MRRPSSASGSAALRAERFRHVRRGVGERQADGHLRAEAHAVTGHADRASVRLGELLDEREADAESPIGAACAVLLLLEHVEHERQKLRRDAFSGVAHLHDAVHDASLRRLLERHRDAAAGWREFHRVQQHVPEDLLHAVAVAVDAQRLGRVDELQRDVLLVSARGDRVERRADQLVETDEFSMERQLASRGARQLEQVLDQPDLEERVALDDLRRVDRPWDRFAA